MSIYVKRLLASKERIKEKVSRKVLIDGVVYESIRMAANSIGVQANTLSVMIRKKGKLKDGRPVSFVK